MYGKICVFSFGVLSEMIKKQIELLNLPVRFVVYNAILDKAVNIAKNLDDVDVFVTSETNSLILKKHLDKPVLAVKKNDFNIFTALLEASKYHSRVMFINLSQTNAQLEKIKELLNIEIYQEVYHTDEDLFRIIKELRSKGIKCIVGGAYACEIAEKHDIKGILPYSSKSIEETLVSAAELANLMKRETTEKSQLKTVMEFSRQGILVVNSDGVITLSNPIAQQVFEIPAMSLVGNHINEVIPGVRIDSVLNKKVAELNEICTVKNKNIFLNKIPIALNNNITNILITFDDVIFIQSAEHTIRKQLFPKGFFAKSSFGDIIFKDSSFKSIIEIAKKYARSNEAIVISGETGTGKEVLAQAIHNHSDRRDNAFVAINCTSLPESLLESELFGYEEGAFTGAKKGGKQGLFEMAHNGTIFLDEIAEIQPSIQVKLLRVLQEREVMRIGGDKLIPVNIRVIAATNKNLGQMVADGKFREDLFYRLSILELKLPPLRQRDDDVFWLFVQFINNHSTAKMATQIINQYSTFKQVLAGYSWPGNIRELENCVKRIFVLMDTDATPGQILRLLQEYITEKKKSGHQQLTFKQSNVTDLAANRFTKEWTEKEIYETIVGVNGNKSEAARILGMSRTTLWRKLKKEAETGEN